MENERLYQFTLDQSSGNGYLHCAAQAVLDATKILTVYSGSKEIQYRNKLIFLTEGRIVEMVASCMGYDIAKFRKACVATLEKSYLIERCKYKRYW